MTAKLELRKEKQAEVQLIADHFIAECEEHELTEDEIRALLSALMGGFVFSRKTVGPIF